MENRFEIQGNSLIIHLPKEVDHMVTDEIRRDSDDIIDRKSTRLNSSHSQQSRMPSSA